MKNHRTVSLFIFTVYMQFKLKCIYCTVQNKAQFFINMCNCIYKLKKYPFHYLAVNFLSCLSNYKFMKLHLCFCLCIYNLVTFNVFNMPLIIIQVS
jgi:hypothetical protein